ncbi:MAG: hypothetical protein NTW07_12950, partial [candidate division Zixibacteria bacterium]|nr:hypothetical protein [candidate division Zixibacteria bacterium]
MPKLRKYVLAALLTAAACATLAQTPAPQRVDTVYDTVYRVDTVAQTAANDKYYDLAEKALNHRMTTITIILTLIGFLFVSLSILLVVEARRISSKIDH